MRGLWKKKTNAKKNANMQILKHISNLEKKETWIDIDLLLHHVISYIRKHEKLITIAGKTL
jgi:hypothetical protein